MIRLDLGAGPTSPEGFTPLGHAHGSEIYPLKFETGSVDAVRASHCLEHFPHREIQNIVNEWARVLKPGGELHIAVPDFEKIAQGYLAGEQAPIEAYTMGGQTDADDFHKALFDRNQLRTYLANAGLVLLRPWVSDIQDCASLPVSLNWSGRKPYRSQPKVVAVMSTPRLGYNDMWMSALLSLPKLGVDLIKVTGAFWDQCLTSAFDEAIEDPSVDYLLGIDYDSVFHAGHVQRLIETVCAYPDIDALAPVQASRHSDTMLFGMHGAFGSTTTDIDRTDIEKDIFPVKHAHFGLTLINAAKLRALPRPWMFTTTDANGKYGDGHTDPDIQFWRNWEKAGNSLYIAPRVTIGHLELMVRWPDQNMMPSYQAAKEWDETRRPPDGTWTGVSE